MEWGRTWLVQLSNVRCTAQRKETQRSRNAKHQDKGEHERTQCACAANTETVLVQHQQVDTTNGSEAFRGVEQTSRPPPLVVAYRKSGDTRWVETCKGNIASPKPLYLK